MDFEVGPLLELIGDVQGLLDLGAFRLGLLAALLRAVPADWISLNDIGPDPESAVVITEPEFPPAYRFSDVISTEELHALDLYREFYGPIGLEHQIAFTLQHEPPRLLGMALSRRDEDFSDPERALLDAARPFLIQAYRNAIEHSEVVSVRAAREGPPSTRSEDDALAVALDARGLTAREAEVLGWILTGRSTRAVGDALGLSERTIQKHLERCYRKLGVHSRSEAATLVWSLVGEN